MSIYYAIEKNDIQFVQNIISSNPNCIFDQNRNYQTPLHYAVIHGNCEIIALLCKTAIALNKPDYLMQETAGGFTALDFAVTHTQGDFGIIKTLLSFNLDINYKNKDGLTILHKLIMAIGKKIDLSAGYQMMELFLSYGINPLQTDNGGIDTYLNYLKMFELPKEFWYLLFSYGAGININTTLLLLGFSEEKKETLMEYATAGHLVYGYHFGEKITPQMPGYMNALTDANSLSLFFNHGSEMNCKPILRTIVRYALPKLIQDNLQEQASELNEIAIVLKNHDIPSLRDQALNKVKFFKEKNRLTPEQLLQLNSLPHDLKECLKDVIGLDMPLNNTPNEPSKKPTKS